VRLRISAYTAVLSIVLCPLVLATLWPYVLATFPHVFVVDEMSMLSQQNLFFILLRIVEACGYKDIPHMLQHILIILSGDLFQVGRLGILTGPLAKASKEGSHTQLTMQDAFAWLVHLAACMA